MPTQPPGQAGAGNGIGWPAASLPGQQIGSGTRCICRGRAQGGGGGPTCKLWGSPREARPGPRKQGSLASKPLATRGLGGRLALGNDGWLSPLCSWWEGKMDPGTPRRIPAPGAHPEAPGKVLVRKTAQDLQPHRSRPRFPPRERCPPSGVKEGRLRRRCAGGWVCRRQFAVGWDQLRPSAASLSGRDCSQEPLGLCRWPARPPAPSRPTPCAQCCGRPGVRPQKLHPRGRGQQPPHSLASCSPEYVRAPIQGRRPSLPYR